MKIFLIADDSPVVRKVARRLVEDLGFVVQEASTTDEVVAFCRESEPDALLIDWDMPGGFDAVECIRQVRTLPGGKEMRILYCTSEVMLPEMTRAKRAGANGFVLKPYNRKILAQKFVEAGLLDSSQKVA